MKDEMVMLRDTFEGALSQACPPNYEPPEYGYMDAQVWNLATSLGWDSVGLSEEAGGFGGGVGVLVLLAEMCGRHRVAVPLWETALSRWALEAAGGEQPRTAEVITIADGTALTAKGTRGARRYSGLLRGVPWAQDAAAAVVTGPDGGLAVLDLAAAAVTIELAANLAGEGRFDVTLDHADVSVFSGDEATRAGSLLLQRAGLLNSASMLGALRRIVEITHEHTASRQQFGRPLARFQLVGAHLAEMTAQTTLVGALLGDAVVAHDAGKPTASTMSLEIVASQAATSVARSAHQCHGAMGVTREYWLQQFTRRVWSWRDAYGLERPLSRSVGATALNALPAAAWATTTPWEAGA